MATKDEVVITSDTVNEQVILAAALVDPNTRIRLLRKLTPDHFHAVEHRAAWVVLGQMAVLGLDYDPATFTRLAKNTVDVRYLIELETVRPDVPANLDYHIGSMLWDHQRTVAAMGPVTALLDALKDANESPEKVRAIARQVATAFDGNGDGHLHNANELIRTQMLEIQKRMDGHACYPYGVHGLDDFETGAKRLMPGAAPGQVTVITGVSGSGKSTFAAHVALNLARQRRRVCYGAWEMNGGMTIELLACISLRWSRAHLMEGKQITPEMKIELEERMHKISKYIVFMKNPFRRNKGEKPTNERNLDIVQQQVADSACDVFIADLWKRCLKSAAPDEEEEALYRQQGMADEMKVHCVLVQQQRLKDVEQREDKRPTREGIKGSGAWTEVADTILGIHRPALWKRMEDDKLEVCILKQRYGKWPLAVEFDWNAEHGSVGGGRSIEYEQPGEQGSETSSFVQPQKNYGKRGR